jgi:hypothetical protein
VESWAKLLAIWVWSNHDSLASDVDSPAGL